MDCLGEDIELLCFSTWAAAVVDLCEEHYQVIGIWIVMSDIHETILILYIHEYQLLIQIYLRLAGREGTYSRNLYLLNLNLRLSNTFKSLDKNK